MSVRIIAFGLQHIHGTRGGVIIITVRLNVRALHVYNAPLYYYYMQVMIIIICVGRRNARVRVKR